MRRLLLAFFIFILLGILLSLVFRQHQGYVLISFNGWQIETSVLFACAAVLLGLWVLALAWRILVTLVFAPRNIRGFVGRRRQRKARRSLYTGLEHMAEARWALAEADLQALAESNEAPGLNHLFSARAAQYQQHLGDRDRYLQKAASRKSISELAVLLTQAELQIAAGQTAEAQATLARLHDLQPRHPWVLRLYAEHAMACGDYARVDQLLPELSKHAALSASRVREMSVAAYQHRLSQQRDVGGLTTTWRHMPKELRRDPEILRHYALCLKRGRADDEAANVIRNALKKQWVAPLALIFGDFKCSDRTEQLATVEEWIKIHGREPELMLIAGRLCLRNHLWGRARSYFEAAAQAERTRADALLGLGHLFEQINEADQARAAYRRGLELRASQ
ncbi:heme biosynthesis HemY N-terminal domain-containing protein [Salinisphaera sp.]|uniref:heme biosynthesis HemY N-terminal domain-containing protein n=1 Tax=Salinisphaera sp. TaxID=1914330 RepID=UPI002D76C7D5|nr:heme biosynthesis HemY N-terminal domain-containing protein [Salinisphaera sp.]HET7315406.1 heme biosynthesis HemY N-terminal domain-containing protein [Salinisphaera sp.]